jgi:hypothetical protein
MCYNFDAEALRKVTMFFKNKNISKNWARYFYVFYPECSSAPQNWVMILCEIYRVKLIVRALN